MAVEVLGTVGVDTAPLGVRELRDDALTYYLSAERPDDIHVQAGRPERADGNIIHHDPFDNARFIAFNVDAEGRLDPHLRRHLDEQEAGRITESMGAFDNQRDVQFKDHRLESLGEPEYRTRMRAVIAAFAMEQTDPGFGFYVRRTLYENRHKAKEHDMMDNAPVGAAQVLVSPCETSIYGERLGMFPEREMAILQISWKKSSETMALRCVSLDRASLGIISQLLQKRGVVTSPDAEPEDYLAYVVPEHFDSQEELDDYVATFVAQFDELVMVDNPELTEKPKQGVVGYDARNIHTSIEEITETPHGQLALNQIHKLDVLLSRHVLESKPLSEEVFDLANQCLWGQRSDGSPLLRPIEKAAVRGLIRDEDEVSLDNEEHAYALKLIKEVHDSAVEESLRDFLAGNPRAMYWMLDKKLTSGTYEAIISKGTLAIEKGRGAGGCGDGGSIAGRILPDARRFPDRYMLAKYGPNAVKWGTCHGCREWGRISTCAPGFCGTCDWKMSTGRRR